jgi:hypothetical protein
VIDSSRRRGLTGPSIGGLRDMGRLGKTRSLPLAVAQRVAFFHRH